MQNTDFATGTADFDLLHPQFAEHDRSPELTETRHQGSNIPEKGIHALYYVWHHPNLGVVTGGSQAARRSTQRDDGTGDHDVYATPGAPAISSGYRIVELKHR